MFDHETRISDLEQRLKKLEIEIKYSLGLYEVDWDVYPRTEVRLHILTELTKLAACLGVSRSVVSKDRTIKYERKVQ